MQRYRRNLLPGGTFFFTVNLLERSSRLLTEEIDALRLSVATAREKHPFQIDAWVVLANHMHCVWTLPPCDSDYPARWRIIKSRFSRRIHGSRNVSPSRASKGELGVWQRRYWEHTIRDERDFAAHIDYVHFNPVKHGYVACPADWPFSSYRRFLARGLYPSGWGASPTLQPAGERT